MGMFKYDGTDFIPFATEADQFLRNNFCYYPGTVLSDGNILLAALNGGAIVIDHDGKEVRKYNRETGVINNTINFTFQDRSGAVWLATANGISRADYGSPVTYFGSANNFSTSVSDIIRHNGIIYVGAEEGVYSLDPRTSDFHRLQNATSQSGGFLEVGGKLLVRRDT